MEDELQIAVSGEIATVTLHRPNRGNALDEASVERFLTFLNGRIADSIGCMVIRGAGENFCTGFDLSDLKQASDGDLLKRFVRIETLLQWIFHAPFPVVAFAHGNAIGAGADLFCACAIRYAAPQTSFRFPGWRFGLALGTRRLAHRIGNETARRLLLQGGVLDSDEGQRLGFVQRLVAAPHQEAALGEITSSMEPLSRMARANILHLTTPDTRESDMAALVATAACPGLKTRIEHYRESLRNARIFPA